MAKTKSTARTARKSRERNEKLHASLYCARAALMTAILSVEGKGVFDEVSKSLRRHVLVPIDGALAEVAHG